MMTALELPARRRELLFLLVSHETGCRYEWIQHLPQARAAGVVDPDIARITGTLRSEWPDPEEALLVDCARTILHNGSCSESQLNGLVGAIGYRQTMEAVCVVAGVRMFSMIINTCDVDIDPAGAELAAGWRKIGGVGPS